MMNPRLILMVLAVAVTVAVASISSRCSLCRGKYCGVGAICNPRTGECECTNAKPFGNPLFGCHRQEDITCDIVADPEVTSFPGSKLPLEIPCRNTMTVIEAAFLGALGKQLRLGSFLDRKIDLIRNRCVVQVDVINAITPQGTIFVDSVSATVTLKVEEIIVVTIQIDVQDDEAVYRVSYFGFNQIFSVIKTDNQKDRRLRKLGNLPYNISVFHDDDLERWEIGLNICAGTTIFYRSWKKSVENQIVRPGVSITTDVEAAMFLDSSTFPGTVCDSITNDFPDVFSKYCTPLKLNRKSCALYGFLYHSPANQPPECTSLISSFQALKDEKKLEAVRKCGPVLTTHAKCVTSNGFSPINLLVECFQAFDQDRDANKVIGNKISCPSVH